MFNVISGVLIAVGVYLILQNVLKLPTVKASKP